jgi:hypothetical protein
MMPLRLVDTEVEIPIDISGTKIIVNALTQGNKLRLAFIAQRFQESVQNKYLAEKDEAELDHLLAGQIIRIEDPEYSAWSSDKIIAGMGYDSKARLIAELFRISSLNEDERKN